MGRLVYGVGINDATYPVNPVILGKRVICPYYDRWNKILKRCYSGKYPAYKGVSVCDSWLVFSNFRSWMIDQDWEGKDLDKDILGTGKVYCPKSCTFLTHKANSFLIDKSRVKGSLPFGVRYVKGKYVARCSDIYTGKLIHLGSFVTKEEAHEKWFCFKRDQLDKLRVTENLQDNVFNKMLEKLEKLNEQ